MSDNQFTDLYYLAGAGWGWDSGIGGALLWTWPWVSNTLPRSVLTRAVWSFWSKPFLRHHRDVWASDKYHLLAWILSLERARRHYPETALYTDDEGVAMLIDGIGLEFTQVSTEINQLSSADPEWWTLGKLFAYRAQNKPFVHIDSDVFLWNPVPHEVASAPVFAQNSEFFPFDGGSWYRPKLYEDRLRHEDGWVPEEWRWYVSRAGNQALCCGIFGGQRSDFISYYAATAIEFLMHPRNQRVWTGMDYKIGDNILFEQYFLYACIAYHSQPGRSRFQGLDVACLFRSTEEAYHTDRAAQIGYTHLIGGAKRNEIYATRLEERVARDYPAQYARCIRYLRSVS